MNTFSKLTGLLDVPEKEILEMDQAVAQGDENSLLQSANFRVCELRTAVMAGFLPLDLQMTAQQYADMVLRVGHAAELYRKPELPRSQPAKQGRKLKPGLPFQTSYTKDCYDYFEIPATHFDRGDALDTYIAGYEAFADKTSWRECRWLLAECQKLAQRDDLPQLIDRHQRLLAEHAAAIDAAEAAHQAELDTINAASAAEAEFMGLPALTGTPKQIAWATTIRADMLKLASTEQQQAIAKGKWKVAATKASFWIDRRRANHSQTITEALKK